MELFYIHPKTMKLFFAVLTLDLHARGIDIGVNMGKGDDKRTSVVTYPIYTVRLTNNEQSR